MDHSPFVNIPLPYAYDALEPHIDRQTMELHHDRHLQTYIDNLNAALKPYPELQGMTLEQLIQVAPNLPAGVGTPIARNAGGVYNHRFYFDGLTPDAAPLETGALSAALERWFGDFSQFQKLFSQAAASVFGSGYAWLAADRRGALRIVTTANQDTPLTMELCPVLNLDVWEHAYYLKHYNKRADYVLDWWSAANWPAAEARYQTCLRQP